MAELLWTAEQRGGGIVALTFGVALPSGAHAFPSAPTWLLHDDGGANPGGARRCYEAAPVVLRASTFCGAFLPEARLVKAISAWLLSSLLQRAGRHLHTYPLVRGHPS
jgi:hypothetical protein